MTSHRLKPGLHTVEFIGLLPRHFGALTLLASPAARFIVCTLLLCLLSLPATAFVGRINSQGVIQHWDLTGQNPAVSTNAVNPNTHAVRFFLGADGFSTTNTAAELNAVRASFGQWQSVPGTSLKFEDAGLIQSAIDVNPEDGTNVLYWAKTSLWVYGGRDYIGGRLGVTYVSTVTNDANNILSGADIVLNGAQYSWFTDFNDTANPNQFIEAVATHEIGHVLGLGHAVAGGSTLFSRGVAGVNSQAGLACDEVTAMQTLYPVPGVPDALCTLTGRVTMGGANVLGAVVTLEDATGNVLAGTASHADGSYQLTCIPPGNYLARVTPLDPAASSRLLSGPDIDPVEFSSAMNDFLSTTNQPINLRKGATNIDFSVTLGTPPFRITTIRRATTVASSYSWASAPIILQPGQSNVVIGVASSTLPTSGATLTISGDGITVGPIDFTTTSGLNFISVTIGVASNATPGLRTFLVTRTSDRAQAYANGFLEIAATKPDYNFDGLDDRFQRKYFPLFTAPEAGANADPDHDRANNLAEYIAGTIPTNTTSVLTLQSVTTDAQGATLHWQSVPEKTYQVYGRPVIAPGNWRPLGSPVTATNIQCQYLDPQATNSTMFYRVQVLP